MRLIVCLLLAEFCTSGCASLWYVPETETPGTILNDDKLFVFVGQKISVREFETKISSEFDPKTGEEIINIPMDSGFVATYRILSSTYGEFEGDVISFKAYDHYGYPAFAKHDVVQLYVSESNGILFHEKYMYDKVYPTADGKWADCGNPYIDISEEVEPAPLKEIEFIPPVVLKTRTYRNPDKYDQVYMDQYLVEPVFEFHGDDAICKQGVYSEELFRIAFETTIIHRRRSAICRDRLNNESVQIQDFRDRFEECTADLESRSLP